MLRTAVAALFSTKVFFRRDHRPATDSENQSIRFLAASWTLCTEIISQKRARCHGACLQSPNGKGLLPLSWVRVSPTTLDYLHPEGSSTESWVKAVEAIFSRPAWPGLSCRSTSSISREHGRNSITTVLTIRVSFRNSRKSFGNSPAELFFYLRARRADSFIRISRKSRRPPLRPVQTSGARDWKDRRALGHYQRPLGGGHSPTLASFYPHLYFLWGFFYTSTGATATPYVCLLLLFCRASGHCMNSFPR